MTDTWSYREDIVRTDAAIDGFDVEARDGSIGSIDESSAEVSASWIVVDTGFWIFGKKRLVPAGVIERIDYDNDKVFVSMTKDEIKDAPDYDESSRDDDEFPRTGRAGYYEPFTGR